MESAYVGWEEMLLRQWINEKTVKKLQRKHFVKLQGSTYFASLQNTYIWLLVFYNIYKNFTESYTVSPLKANYPYNFQAFSFLYNI